jgi:Tol biopolymer transport system component
MNWRLALAACAAVGVFPLTAAANGGRDVLLLSSPDVQNEISTLDITTGHVHHIARGWDASWSPNGTQIAFFSGRNLFVVDRNGNHSRRLTHDVFPDFDAVWSRDGTRIAFLQQPQPAISLGLPVGVQNDIMIVDVATGVVTHLTRDRTARSDLLWSPDGTKLFFRTGVMGAFTGADDVQTGAPSPGLGHIYPVWSGDGRELAFLDGMNGVEVANADGSNARVLVHVDPYTCLAHPSWSPGGRALVFSEGPCESWAQLEIVDVQAGEVRVLTPPQWLTPRAGWDWLEHPQLSKDLAPSWSPDGKWIAFVHAGSRGRVAIIHPNGRGLRIFPITDTGSVLWEPGGN